MASCPILLEPDDLQGLFQHKPFYASVKSFSAFFDVFYFYYRTDNINLHKLFTKESYLICTIGLGSFPGNLVVYAKLQNRISNTSVFSRFVMENASDLLQRRSF